MAASIQVDLTNEKIGFIRFYFILISVIKKNSFVASLTAHSLYKSYLRNWRELKGTNHHTDGHA